MGGKSMNNEKLEDLQLSADLMQTYIVDNKAGSYALFDNGNKLQVSPFYTLDQWSKLNHARVILEYLS